jgi:hypothetical protein
MAGNIISELKILYQLESFNQFGIGLICRNVGDELAPFIACVTPAPSYFEIKCAL